MRYLNEGYDDLIRHSYAYDQKTQKTSSAWKLVKTLYNKNYVYSSDTEPKIPKKIHQIWLGGKLPGKYKKYCDSWQKFNPSWEYKLWTDDDLNSIKITKKEIFDFCPNYANKSDILRYEILNQHGGLYVDTDFECLKSFDDLLYLDFFAGFAHDKDMILYTALIASVARHPITDNCVNMLKKGYNGNDTMKVMRTTGPYYFTECFLADTTKDMNGVVIFPTDFFYPFPNNMRHTSNFKKYIKQCSYAIHYWDVSWAKNK